MQMPKAPRKSFFQRVPSGTWSMGILFGTVGIMVYFAIIQPMNNQEELHIRQLMLRSQIDQKHLGPQGNLPEWSSPFAPKK